MGQGGSAGSEIKRKMTISALQESLLSQLSWHNAAYHASLQVCEGEQPDQEHAEHHNESWGPTEGMEWNAQT